MKGCLSVVMVVLVVIWLVGFFIFDLGAYIHLLLIVALLGIIVRLMNTDN